MDNQNIYVIALIHLRTSVLYQKNNYTTKKIGLHIPYKYTIVGDVIVVIENYKFDWKLTILATRSILNVDIFYFYNII